MSIIRQLSADGHHIRLIIESAERGWDVCEQIDAITTHREHHEDWHRVERAMHRLEHDVRHHRVTWPGDVSVLAGVSTETRSGTYVAPCRA